MSWDDIRASIPKGLRDKPLPRPRARLKLKEDRGSATGLLGVSSIVDYDWEVAVGDRSLPVEEFLRLVRMKLPMVAVRGEWVQFDPGEAEAIAKFFEKRGTGRMRLGEAVGLGLGGEIPGSDMPVEEVRAEGRINQVLSALTALTSLTPLRGDFRVSMLPAPEGFRGQLRPYQVRGVSWLVYLRNLGFGACLADDMGLGKTVEFLAYLAPPRGCRPVAPGVSHVGCRQLGEGGPEVGKKGYWGASSGLSC